MFTPAGVTGTIVRSSYVESSLFFARSNAVPRMRLKFAPGNRFPPLSRTITVIRIAVPFAAVALGRPSLLAVFSASSAVEVISIEAATA